MKYALSVVVSVILHITGITALVILAAIYLSITLFIHPRHMQWYVRIGCRIILLCFGQWLAIKGKAPDPGEGPYLYLPNHSSALDAFLIGACVPEHFGVVAADYNFRIPCWRWIAIRYGAIPIIRDKLDKAINSMRLAQEAIISGLSVVIFPEGTRTVTGLLQEFKKGFAHIAKNTNARIVPIGIRGAFKSYNRNSWILRPGVVTWVWGEINYEIACNYRYCSVEELAKFYHDEVAVLIGEIG